jgi:hypothetical protein
MSRLNPEKLYVEFVCVTSTEPIIPRRYTLTHSDITADLYLTIGLDFAYDKLNFMRDEVFGEWLPNDANYVYCVYLYINSNFMPALTAIRDTVFRKELQLALEAIRYGDNEFFNEYPELDYVPIIVYFQSTDPMFNTVENCGTFSDYNIIA